MDLLPMMLVTTPVRSFLLLREFSIAWFFYGLGGLLLCDKLRVADSLHPSDALA